MDELFKGRHFDREIIVLCVRWYLRYKLSFRDLVGDDGRTWTLPGAHDDHALDSTLCAEFEKRWNRFARPLRHGTVNETYVKIKGRWTYLYRAVDKEGRTVDFLLRAKRDVAAAKAFFRLAFRRQGRLPLKITLDGYQASHRAANMDEHPEGNQCKIRSSKYLNNLINRMINPSSFGSVRCSASSISAKPQRRSPASNSCIGSGRVSSNSVTGRQGQQGSQDLECGSRCVIQSNFRACLARPQNVCTRTVNRFDRDRNSA